MPAHARTRGASPTTAKRLKGARRRILAVADAAFYADGIQQTSVEEIASLAGVSPRVFTKNFPSKEELIVAYIDERHDHDLRLLLAAEDAEMSHHLLFNMVVSEIRADVETPGFRGCAFLNAASECPDLPAVQAAVRSHRDWYLAIATGVLREAGHDHPEEAAGRLVSARDAAMNSSYGDDPVAATADLLQAMDLILAEIPAPVARAAAC
jgi:AcrR family transcriptional regulator